MQNNQEQQTIQLSPIQLRNLTYIRTKVSEHEVRLAEWKAMQSQFEEQILSEHQEQPVEQLPELRQLAAKKGVNTAKKAK